MSGVKRRRLYASNQSYHDAVKVVRDRLETGVKVVAEDSTTPGDKYTHCNVGLCANDLGDAKDGTYWVDRTHHCPHDRRAFSEDGGPPAEAFDASTLASGCFWSCRIFRPKKRDNDTRAKRVARAEAALRYAEGIKEEPS
jgi:hypothetical protein